MTRVLLAGVSTRGFAESAVRAGYDVIAVDGFGDLDLRACATEVHVVRVGGRFRARAAVAAVRDVSCEAAVYEAGVANLTKDATPILVHTGDGQPRQVTLIRLEQPAQ